MTAGASDSGDSPTAELSVISARTRGFFSDRYFVLACSVVLLLAVWLRLVQSHESLWLDELHTAWTVCDDWGQIAPRAEIGNQSPLYFYLVAVLTGIGGLNEFNLRLPSALAGVGLAGLAGWLVARWTGSRTSGLLVALLVAVDRTHVFYAQEARPYACLQLVGLIHAAAFVSVLTEPRRCGRVLWVVSGIVLYYLHYTAVLLLLAEAVAYGALSVIPPWRPAYRLRQFATDAFLIALGALPSIFQVAQIAARREAWSMFISKDLPLSKILSLFPLAIYLLLPAGIGIVAWAWRWGWDSVRRSGSGQRSELRSMPQDTGSPEHSALACFRTIDPRLLIVLCCWLFVPLMLAWVLTVNDLARLFFLRYLVISAVVPALLSGLLLRCYPGRLSRVLGGVAVACVLVWHGGLLTQWRHDGRVIGDRRQDWRGAVALLREVVPREAPVFVRSGLIEADRLRDEASPQLVHYCLLPVSGIYRLEHPPDRLFPLPASRSSELTDAEVRRVAEAGEAWFLLIGSPRSIARLRRELAARLTIDGKQMRLVEHHRFGDVAVLRYTLQGRPDSAGDDKQPS